MNTSDALIRDGLPASVLAASLREVWITIRTDGLAGIVIGDGTRENPWDGSTALKLDFILSTSLSGQENVTIHLGPGAFRTGGARAFGTLYSKWRPNSGWKIIGSGQNQTTLRLTVYGEVPETGLGVYGYWIVHSGSSYLDGFEISDLTLDCGMDDQPLPPDADPLNPWPQTMCAGIYLTGRNTSMRIRLLTPF